jgi:hypothetical protein
MVKALDEHTTKSDDPTSARNAPKKSIAATFLDLSVPRMIADDSN